MRTSALVEPRTCGLGGPLKFGGVAQSVDEEGDHALAVRDSLVRYGGAQQGDGAQQVPGADVGTDFTGRCRGVEQRAEGGFESLVEVAGLGVERRVARVKGGGQSSFGREELSVPAEPVRECRSWLVRCG